MSLILITMLFTSAGVYAQDAQFPATPDIATFRARAGILPDSPWYGVKLATEWFWRNMQFNWKAEINVLNQQIEEREAEAWVMLEEKGERSHEFRRALGMYMDYQHDVLNLVKEHNPIAYQNYQDLLTIQVGRNEELEKAINNAPAKAALELKMNDLRVKLIQARNINNIQEIDVILKDLTKAKYDYLDLTVFQDDMFLVFSDANNNIENYFTGSAKIELVLRRAAAEAERAKRDGADPDLARINDLIAQTQQAVADAQVKHANDLAQRLQKAMDQSVKNIQKKKAAEMAKQDLTDQGTKAPEKKEPAPAPVQQPILQEIPSESVNTNPLVLLGFYNGLQGEVGTFFAVNFGGQGGLPPYHFQLNTGGGFPPMGLILDINGRLSGTPTVEGTSNFGVCVVDTSGANKCYTFTMVVAPEVIVPPPPPPPPPPAPDDTTLVSGTVTGTTCNVVQLNAGIGGTVDYYDAVISGTASGPVGTTIYGGVITCDSWNGCYRSENDPSQTGWEDTQRVYVSRDPLANPANNGTLNNKIYIRNNITLMSDDVQVCP